MSSKEEIREGLYKELIAQAPTEEFYGKVDRILGYLHSQGVVIKTGEIREIIGTAASPESFMADGVGISWERNAHMFRIFKEAGYAAVKPIKEV